MNPPVPLGAANRLRRCCLRSAAACSRSLCDKTPLTQQEYDQDDDDDRYEQAATAVCVRLPFFGFRKHFSQCSFHLIHVASPSGKWNSFGLAPGRVVLFELASPSCTMTSVQNWQTELMRSQKLC